MIYEILETRRRTFGDKILAVPLLENEGFEGVGVHLAPDTREEYFEERYGYER